MTGCLVCANTALADPPARESVVRTSHWRVAHAFDSDLPEWLVVVPLQHVTALDELPEAAHAELGLLLGRLSRGLREVVGCVKTYVMLFAEAEGFGHLHVHLVPRMSNQPPQSRGPAVFRHLGAIAGTRVPEAEMDAVAHRLAAHFDRRA